MGIDAYLKTETGEVLDEIGDVRCLLANAPGSAFAETRLLKYLGPLGDTVFNQAQAPDLADDIRIVCQERDGTALAEHLKLIQPLVERLSSETYLYLWFVGD